MPTKIKRFEITERAHEMMTCVRCRRKMRATESAVSLVEPGRVTYRHAGRACPPCVDHNRDPHLRVVQKPRRTPR